MKTLFNHSENNYIDILFQGKNKAYGSYVLRKNYNQRTSKAGLIALSVATLFWLGSLVNKSEAPLAHNNINEKVYELAKPPVDKTTPLVEEPIKAIESPKTEKAIINTSVAPKIIGTRDFTVPDIIKDELVDPNKNISKTNINDPREVGMTTQDGSTDGTGIHPGTYDGPSGDGTTLPTTENISNTGTKNTSTPFVTVEKMPKPGYDFSNYLNKATKYPTAALEDNIQGKIYVQFVVDVDGSIIRAEIVKGQELGGGLAEEALRVVKKAPKWEPGEQNGKKVRVYYTVPVTFKMN